ncbi:MAG: beta-galactosidase GalB [Actinomycetota bacterium]
MKIKNKTTFLPAMAIVFLVSISSIVFAQLPRERSSFNENWRFQKDDPKDAEGALIYEKIKDWVRVTGNEFVLTADAVKSVRPSGNLGENVAYTKQNFDDSAWRQLNLPHDWAIEGDFQPELSGETGKRPFAGTGWYRKHFTVPNNDRGKQIYLDFDGAMAYPAVWLNGKFVGGWAYGYSSFRLDLTPYLEFGKENVLSVRLDNPPESSRWYPGAGIYRNVWLVKTAPVHVAHWGTYVTTPEVDQNSASVNIKTTIDNDTKTSATIKVQTLVYELGANNQKTGSAVASSEKATLNLTPNSNLTSETNFQIKQPKLWNLQTPNRYIAHTNIEQNGKIIDSYETNFGIRTIKFDADKGFLLNGEHVYIKGVCDHHDLGALGTAINIRALERQLEILKEMGVNAIRTSHNPPAPELLELADKMGFLVMDEAFDAWASLKKKNDYAGVFKDWHEKDLRAQIRRDRNHPSVILWSTGNEIHEQRVEGHPIAMMLAKIVHEEDPTRMMTVGANGTDSGYNGFQKTVDVFGYNYKPMEYAKFHAQNPLIPLFASETASTISSRGEYFFPVVEDKSKGLSDFQMSSYDLYAPRWATTPDAEFAGQDKNPFVAGEFVWTGFDYLGEPTPYDGKTKTMPVTSDPELRQKLADELEKNGSIQLLSRSSYFGIVDLCGFKKDRFYIYQARWRPDLPMAHILPHWNWAERIGQLTPVHVYTSGDEAELFLNGKSLGRKKRGQFEYRLRWDDVVYEPGELRVVAYKNGKVWAEETVKTTGEASQIALNADRSTISADGSDLSYVTVTIADKNGLMVPRSKNRIKFEISGAGEIVAVDNGDATDLESFQSNQRKAFNGMALVIIRSIRGKSGKITIKAVSDNLKGAQISISSNK